MTNREIWGKKQLERQGNSGGDWTKPTSNSEELPPLPWKRILKPQLVNRPSSGYIRQIACSAKSHFLREWVLNEVARD